MNKTQHIAANCANAYIYDPTCIDCADKCLAREKGCFDLRISVDDRLKRCKSCKYMKMDRIFIAEDNVPMCRVNGTYCEDINSCDNFTKKE